MTATTLDLDTLHLDKGSHTSPEDGACIMEAVAFLAGEKWSDTPECASPVIGAFLRSWNDCLPDDERQQLKRYIPRLIGTAASPKVEDRRAWMALDWLVRTYTPAWLHLAGLNNQATMLTDLPEFVPGMDVPPIRPAIDQVRKDADAAWAAAGAAAWAASRDAAWDAARAAAWAAAWAAARAALRPTVVGLQAPAFDLLDRMIACGSEVPV